MRYFAIVTDHWEHAYPVASHASMDNGSKPLTPEATMARPLYTVSFLHSDGTQHVSRFFQTLAAARKWAKWLRTTRFAVKTFLYEGPAGANLLEERGA